MCNCLDLNEIICSSYPSQSIIESVSRGHALKVEHINEHVIEQFGMSDAKKFLESTCDETMATLSNLEFPLHYLLDEKLLTDKAIRTQQMQQETVYRPFPNHDGTLVPLKTIKVPIIKSKKCIAVVGFGQRPAENQNILDSLRMYETYYNHPKKAVKFFMIEHGILNFFEKLPSIKTVKVLIFIANSFSVKEVARHFDMSSSTVTEMLNRVKTINLKESFFYYDVLKNLNYIKKLVN